MGCDWQNVPLHLPHTFTLTNSEIQVAMMGEHGLAWPRESLHIEAPAWFDPRREVHHRRMSNEGESVAKRVDTRGHTPEYVHGGCPVGASGPITLGATGQGQ
jgi:hypothetical protein